MKREGRNQFLKDLPFPDLNGVYYQLREGADSNCLRESGA